MKELKYTVIRNREQYDQYCNALEGLLAKGRNTKTEEDEIELLTLLIEKWDEVRSPVPVPDPVSLLKSFMAEHKLKPNQLMEILGIKSRGHLHEILSYRKGLSKGTIRKLAGHFKVSQEAFNKPYALVKAVSANGAAKKEGKQAKAAIRKPQPANGNSVRT